MDTLMNQVFYIYLFLTYTTDNKTKTAGEHKAGSKRSEKGGKENVKVSSEN